MSVVRSVDFSLLGGDFNKIYRLGNSVRMNE